MRLVVALRLYGKQLLTAKIICLGFASEVSGWVRKKEKGEGNTGRVETKIHEIIAELWWWVY